MTVEQKQRTRRGVALYETNPFISTVLAHTKQGSKRISSGDGSRMMVVSEAGEIVAPAGFWQYQEVDRTQFVKLYIGGVKAFQGLTKPGTTMFEILYNEVQDQIGKDQIYLSFGAIDQVKHPMSEATYSRGMRELVAKQFLAPSTLQGWFFLNPDYLWNGDRLAFVKEVRIKGTKLTSDQAKRDGLEARGQMRIDLQNP
jgi:hypothetical protein